MKLFGYEFTVTKRSSNDIAECISSDKDNVLWKELMGDVSGEVTREKMLSIPAVWSAVDTISKTLASLPFYLYRSTDDGSEEAIGHAIYNLLRLEPAPYVTSFNFRRALFAQACFGDAFARIYTNGIGRAMRLEVLDSQNVEVFETTTGDVFYIHQHTTAGVYRTEVLYPYEVLHLRGFSIMPERGLDMRTINRTTLSSAVAAAEYSDSFYTNGAHVNGALVYPDKLNLEQIRQAQSKIRRVSGACRAGGTMILDNGVRYERIGVEPDKAALLGFKKGVVDDTARFMGLPPHLLANLDNASFNNIEAMSVQFVTQTLRPWAVQAEQEFAIKLLTETEKQSGKLFFRFNLDGLLRGDTKSRADYYTKLFSVGALSPNDIRTLENLNRREGGDTYFVPLNMSGGGNDANAITGEGNADTMPPAGNNEE